MDQRLRGVIAAVDALLAELKNPLSLRASEAGWDDRARLDWQQHFERLRARLVAGQPPDGDQYHLMRWLNFDGIGLGPLSDKIGEIQLQLWDLFADDAARARRKVRYTGRDAKRMLRELGIKPQPSRLRECGERVRRYFADTSN